MANGKAKKRKIFTIYTTDPRPKIWNQISKLLPRWMLSKQANGQVLGFTPAWVIAYCKPGKSGQVAYNIAQQYGEKLNLIDFEVDRYELDRLLTHNWDPVTQEWTGTPDIYSSTDVYDKYLVFPRRNILV